VRQQHALSGAHLPRRCANTSPAGYSYVNPPVGVVRAAWGVGTGSIGSRAALGRAATIPGTWLRSPSKRLSRPFFRSDVFNKSASCHFDASESWSSLAINDRRRSGSRRGKGVLPSGAVFPLYFGVVPSTLGEDGDPLDVLVLMDAPAFVGCIVPCRLVSLIEAERTEDGKTEKNGRSSPLPRSR
jgi:hypothetical protein